ncbi:hypothetical protein D018_3195B, partial [Vibrio parahaemolyticus VP2007-007]
GAHPPDSQAQSARCLASTHR